MSDGVEKTYARVFCRMVLARSAEHEQAVMLFRGRLPGQLISILRQELDSLVRVVFLLNQSPDRRGELIQQSMDGARWTELTKKNKSRQITDREMVALSEDLNGWTQSVYQFGCAFIHLSRLHDYADSDPLARLPVNDRLDVLKHMHRYHASPTGPDVEFDDLIQYLPSVFRKVRGNLKCHVRDLERACGVEAERAIDG